MNPFLCILDGFVLGALGKPQSLRSNSNATAVQGGHANFESLPFLPEKIFFVNPDIIQNNVACFGSADAQLVLYPASGKTFQL